MSIEVRVPELGESIVDATIASWLKKEGDTIKRGDTLAELETDKINVEVNAEQDGVLQKVLKQIGDVVAVGEAICVIGEGASVASNGAVPAEKIAAAPAEAKSQQNGMRDQSVASGTAPFADAQRPPSPLARRIAAEHHVDIAQVRGSSPHGRVTKDDVVSYLEQNVQGQAKQPPVVETQAVAPQPRPVTPPAPQAVLDSSDRREERIRMSRRRQTIAQRLVEAQHTAAMLTTFNEIDMSAVMDVRSRRKDAFKEKHNVSLGFMSFFTRAVVGALKAYPRLNAEIQGNDIILKHYYDISIAVSTDEGLVVPVVRNADRKGFAQIEREVADLAKRARANTLSLADLQGGTFTITNGGVFGSLLSTPILNAPQVGILGMHKIEQRPIALDGVVIIRPMMYVALSYDHRIVDGSEAVRFLTTVKELIEDPESLLLEG
ncbi:2-oxoglutarate dehydrogenase complex dihydrolipoyllysine-residue succinyltransferase [Dictyobacter arantiisoli]|uniref:Dihydrolipoyllysine-residue succinyltransferase component of 2-oxoglutarate dehydrogenase complex n=1 Tax=Dictyobacter arantiisoli TaxID=2014874 RepID=A0A5A5TEH8_9CHLR|nr:2-oxoglutarate dehydrogenase complex dihydrolipoyllysine-residue succinyltransferase [Dictyobacter arantiisoli]GCF09483.1 dihydrolipoyllysine-residue succinyltransferase component of 2-oxoglutarate dehydrogenase complex [Dictyobacter arantiisoli]